MVSISLSTAFAIPLLVYAWTGAFSRYVADDYCWAGLLRTEGFLNSQVSWYTTYSPRYAFTFLVNLTELAGPAIVPVLPTLAILGAVGVTTWTLRQLRLPGIIALVCAELLTLATLYTAPDMGQSLYWQTGMLTYLLPLVLCTFLIGWLARAVHTTRLAGWQLAVSALVTFVAGGLSEAYLIPQNVSLSLAVVVCAVATRGTTRRVLLSHLVAALAGGVLALVVIVAAPATANRVGGSPADLWLAASAAIATAAFQLVRLLRFFAPAVVLCLAAPGLMAMSGRTRIGPIRPGWFVAVTAAAAITLPFCYFPSFYAQNGNPPARSLIVPGAILIGYTFLVGCALAGPVTRRFASASPSRERRRAPASGEGIIAAALILCVIPLGIAATSLPERAQTAEYAALWDAEDQLIRASREAGQTELTVPRLPKFLGEDFVGTDRRDWFNCCVARYYGVQSIAAAD